MSFFQTHFTLVWIITAASFAVAQKPDWSCNFSYSSCRIMQENEDDGTWEREWQWISGWNYRANFNEKAVSSATVECTLPLGFSATSGRLLFNHYSSDSHIEILVCENGGVFEIVGPTLAKWEKFSKTIQCSQESKIEISFRAVRGESENEPDIRLDNIEVFLDIDWTTDSPSTSRKSTSGITTLTSMISSPQTLPSMSSSYHTTIEPYTSTSSTFFRTMDSGHSTTGSSPVFATSASASATPTVSSTSGLDSTSMITGSHTSATSTGKPRTFETTVSLTETTPNSTMPNPANQKGDPKAAIISVSVILVFLFVVTIAVILILHHRRVPQQNDPYVGPGKRFDDNAYINAAFSAKDHVELNHPDVIKDAHLSNGLQTQHHPPSSTNPQGSSLHHLQQDDCNGYYRGLDNSAMGQGDYMDLKHQGVVSHQAEEEGQEYFVLEEPGDEDSDGQHGTGTSSSDVDDQAYDHLNRGIGNGNIQNELREGHYGAAAVMSAEDEYNILVHGNEADINPRSSKNRPKPKEMTPQNGHDAGNEYQTLGLVDENDPTRYSDTAENHYNVLGETDEDAVGYSANTRKDAGSSDDYHVLHSGKETGDYHLYQHPEQELSSGSPADSSKPEDEDYTYYYPVVDGQGSGVTKESLPQGEGDDYYSVVNVQGQMDTSGVAGDTQHEPIYSSDVYSELV